MQCYCKLKIKKLLLSYAQNAEGNVLSSTEGKRIDKDRGFRMSTESKTRMTEGSIARRIILFAIPLFLENLFQQLYNTADFLIVGNFLRSNALAAVSSSGNLIFLLVGFINGIAMGPVLLSPGIMEQKIKTVCKSRYIQQWLLESWPGLY